MRRAPPSCWWSRTPSMALSIADRGYVLETGKIVTSGTGTELLASPEIKKAYLGG